jgi:phage replication-related protein YjqB (UPF0714/DUF867 family)
LVCASGGFEPFAIISEAGNFLMNRRNCGTKLASNWYGCFAELAAKEIEGQDFRICVSDRGADVLIMAPHVGRIEVWTSQIARAIAAEDYSLYLFEGLRAGRAHMELHITSAKFDEPQAIEIAKISSRLISAHGRENKRDSETVWIGGLDRTLAKLIEKSFNDAGFKAVQNSLELAGKHKLNICNRSKLEKGVQLEIPRALRDRLANDNLTMANFAEAARKAIRNA